jgi:hypothetical protein
MRPLKEVGVFRNQIEMRGRKESIDRYTLHFYRKQLGLFGELDEFSSQIYSDILEIKLLAKLWP